MGSQLVQLIVDGLSTGSIYAALALAIVLVHRATGLVNFAQGAMAVLSTYFAYTLIALGMWPLAGIVIAITLSFAFGAGVERFIIRKFERGPVYVAVVVTIGLFVLIEGVAGAIWSYNTISFPSVFPLTTVSLFGAVIGVRALGTIAVLIVVIVLLQLLFLKTKVGLALRAVADNPESSALSGLPVGRLLMVGWGLAAALGALAGTLIAPSVYLVPGMLDFVLVYALAAAILGGMNSPIGAVVAAWFIGIAENLAGAYVPFIGDDLKIAVPLAVMFIILRVRPQGLFGRKEVVRV